MTQPFLIDLVIDAIGFDPRMYDVRPTLTVIEASYPNDSVDGRT